MVPNRATGLWSIELSPEAGPAQHVSYHTSREAGSDTVSAFRSMLLNLVPESGGNTRGGGALDTGTDSNRP